jgi:hypothetical protein
MNWALVVPKIIEKRRDLEAAEKLKLLKGTGFNP